MGQCNFIIQCIFEKPVEFYFRELIMFMQNKISLLVFFVKTILLSQTGKDLT